MYSPISPLFGMMADSLRVEGKELVECIIKLHQKNNNLPTNLNISIGEAKVIVAKYFEAAKANAKDDSIRSIRISILRAIFKAYRAFNPA